ncbi:FAD-binding oxidoreductase [Crenobacter sp. SG2303]|uniref:FAD-binding oxidoreductase n=1 Tax=Crenobacter oryzisoli TaxID=3056844 RepID=A0ABT7XMI0_9NEIS|nr:FAD-binding oxidoreductase [Crenobacter sp. SG2303]MDN0074981.1 FAD-binding oxidoreductase [Crenobacter sp. SG2303]
MIRQFSADAAYAVGLPVRPVQAVLAGEQHCEVAVLGGGLTGLTAALELARAGVDVALVEGHRCGWGASGRNGGQALAGLAASMDGVEAALGLDAARRIWAMTLEGLARLKRQVGEFGIDCGLAEHGYVYAALNPPQLAGLAAWQRKAERDYGYDGLSLLDAAGIRGHIGSERYVGGAYDANEVHLNPLKYTLALADAALAAGVCVYEHSPVSSIERGVMPRLVTARGSLRCRSLVLAGNAYLEQVPELARTILPVESHIIATEPLGGRVCDILPTGVAVSDCNHVLDYYRCSHDGRLLFGGRAGPLVTQRAEHARERMLKVFPQLADVRIDYAWGGYVDVTLNKLPHFGWLTPNILFAQGFSGHGLALTGLAGQLIAEALTGSPERFALFAKLPQHRLPPAMRPLAIRLGTTWYQWQDWRSARA